MTVVDRRRAFKIKEAHAEKVKMRELVTRRGWIKIGFLLVATTLAFAALVTQLTAFEIPIPFLIPVRLMVLALILAVIAVVLPTRKKDLAKAEDENNWEYVKETICSLKTEKAITRDGLLFGIFYRDGEEIRKLTYDIPVPVDEVWYEDWSSEQIEVEDNEITIIRRWRN